MENLWKTTILLLLTAYELRPAQAQLFGDSITPQRLCPSLWDNANATGAQKLADGSLKGSYHGFASNEVGQWKVAVRTNYSANAIASAQSTANESYPDTVANVWLDPFEGVDLNDGRNSFSACAYIIHTIPENTNRLGQDDDTNCYRTLSEKCVNAITERAASIAQWLVLNPTLGPYSNLTPPILGPICDSIQGELGTDNHDDFPSECKPFFFTGDRQNPDSDLEIPTFNTLQLTGNETTPTNCSFSEGGLFYRHIMATEYNSPPGNRFPYNGTSPVDGYDRLVHQVFPILTVVMPAANVSRQSMISDAFAQMACIRASNITQGSRTPSPLPRADAVHFPPSTSWYGVRVGVPIAIVVVLIAAAIAGWLIWRRRRRSARTAPKLSESGTEDGRSTEHSTIQKDGAEVYQLSSKVSPAQLHANHKVEMDGGNLPRYPQGNDGTPQEVMGDSPADVKSRA